MYEYRALVTRVVDGDTFHAAVDLGFKISTNTTFRLGGIDTPETWRPKSEAERVHGQAAKQRVKDLIDQKEVIIRTAKTGKYGRWIAYVILDDGKDLGQLLINEGFEKRTDYVPDKV